jgi:hypothetical protein
MGNIIFYALLRLFIFIPQTAKMMVGLEATHVSA